MTPRTGDPGGSSLGTRPETLADMLVRLRKRANLSLRDVAQEAGGVTASYIGILEKGHNPKTRKPSRPTQELVLRLARSLRATFDETLELNQLAGYETLTAAADQDAVATVLSLGRLPDVISNLIDLERD